MKKVTMGLIAVAAVALMACDQSADEQTAENQASEETAIGEEAAVEGEAVDIEGAMQATEASCKAAAEALAVWVGRPWAEAEETVRAGEGVATIRVFGPNDAVTMDYRPDRLNVELGEDRTITRIFCG
jgi:ABC-type Fe3+-hydroxamate transport system substrate-binding protein